MTVLYFSSTGNNLYVAKRIGDDNYSIPQLIEKEIYDFEDDTIGVVFPVYGLCIPPFIEEYLGKISVKCDYLFAIATYGFFSGAICGEIKKLTLKNNRKFDYINKLKMAENCITFSDMAKQKGDSDKQQSNIEKILNDIACKKRYECGDSILGKITTSQHLKNYEFPTGVGITEKITVNNSCRGCGLCEKVCPMNNIKIVDGTPVFGHNCVSCAGCIQNCPNNAMHHSEEKSEARYRNPHVEVRELMYR